MEGLGRCSTTSLRNAGDRSQTISRSARVRPVFGHECCGQAQRVLDAARRKEQHRVFPACHADEHPDVEVPTLAGGPVEVDAAHHAQVEARNGLAHVVLRDVLRACISDAPQPGCAASTGRSRTSVRPARSDSRFKALHLRAHGTAARCTPCSEQFNRRTDAMM